MADEPEGPAVGRLSAEEESNRRSGMRGMGILNISGHISEGQQHALPGASPLYYVDTAPVAIPAL
jgi:hypothetical protein